MYEHFGKRLFDLVVVVLTAPLWLPLMGLVAVVVRVALGSPVIFRQSRPGRHFQPFVLLKFRTMTFARDAAGKLLSDVDRLTPVGRMLRTSSLDEFPALINVLKGEMSLVGPRPLLVRDLDRGSTRRNRRFAVRSGITGWAQVNGRNALAWDRKFELDLWYVENMSLWTDLRILFMTIGQVLAANNISPDDRAMRLDFRGFDDEG